MQIEVDPITGIIKRYTDDGALCVTDDQSPTDGEFRIARCMNGNTGLVPGAAVTVSAVDIIAWSMPSGKKRLAVAASRDRVTGNTHLGWWLTWNAGNPVTAKDRLVAAMATGLYATGATVDADTNSGSLVIPPDAGFIWIPSDADITDIYTIPISSAGTVVGNSVLTGVCA
jgi:hypothetical protein